MIDLTHSGVSWLDITQPPPKGKSWYVYLRTLQMEREHKLAVGSRHYAEYKSRFIAFRFAYDLARQVAKDEHFGRLVLSVMNPDDMEGWFPKRLFGCPCFRESHPGSIFKELVPTP